jgi:hypothetical protein
MDGMAERFGFSIIPEARNFQPKNWHDENALKIMCFAEGANGGSRVLMLRIDGVIEATNVGGSELAREFGECGTKLGKFSESGLADNGNSVIGRKIVKVVFESDQAEGIDLPVGGVASDDIHLMIEERAINEAEIHGGGGRSETQIVAARESRITVRAFLKFIANAGTPLRRDGNKIGDSPQVKIVGVIGANDHGEGIFKAKWLGQFKLKTLAVKLLYTPIDGGGIRAGGLIEHGGEGRSGVFDV